MSFSWSDSKRSNHRQDQGGVQSHQNGIRAAQRRKPDTQRGESSPQGATGILQNEIPRPCPVVPAVPKVTFREIVFTVLNLHFEKLNQIQHGMVAAHLLSILSSYYCTSINITIFNQDFFSQLNTAITLYILVYMIGLQRLINSYICQRRMLSVSLPLSSFTALPTHILPHYMSADWGAVWQQQGSARAHSTTRPICVEYYQDQSPTQTSLGAF